MYTATDVTAEDKPNSMRGDRTSLRDKFPVCQKNAFGKRGGCATIEQIPWLPIRVHGPTADYPGVVKVQTLMARPLNLPVRLAEQHGVTLMNRKLCWTNSDLNRHVHPCMLLPELAREGK